jgi:hypothetical protein
MKSTHLAAADYSCRAGWDQQAEATVGLRSPGSRSACAGRHSSVCGLRRPTNDLRELVPPYMNYPG